MSRQLGTAIAAPKKSPRVRAQQSKTKKQPVSSQAAAAARRLQDRIVDGEADGGGGHDFEVVDRQPAVQAAHALLGEDGAQPVRNGRLGPRRRLLQRRAHLLQKRHGHLARVVRGPLQQQRQHLQREQRVRDGLIHQMRDEPRCRPGGAAVVGGEGALEGRRGAHQQQLSDLRELGVDDGDERGDDGGVGGRRELRLEQGAAEQAAPADEVFGKELGQDVAEVAGVDLVDEAVYRLEDVFLVFFLRDCVLCEQDSMKEREKMNREREKKEKKALNKKGKKHLLFLTFRSASQERRWNASPSRSAASPSMRASLKGGM